MFTRLETRKEQVVVQFTNKKQIVVDETWFMLEKKHEQVFKILTHSQEAVDDGNILIFLYRHIYNGGRELSPSQQSSLKRLRRKILETDKNERECRFQKSAHRLEYEIGVRQACAKFNIDQEESR